MLRQDPRPEVHAHRQRVPGETVRQRPRRRATRRSPRQLRSDAQRWRRGPDQDQHRWPLRKRQDDQCTAVAPRPRPRRHRHPHRGRPGRPNGARTRPPRSGRLRCPARRDVHLVALLGDRTGLNERTVEATFMGETAHFPAGPFLLASVMKCPVYLTFGLYRSPNQYDLSCEPFAEKLHLPRKNREAGLREVVQRFADRLEHYARKAPENWFNFYDFWNKDRTPEASRTRHHRKVSGGAPSV
ncbi:MAG TPA: hypothetical protein EYP98_08780 [Planctomycetes bacterium]|nr:hypothetical protein [Planctomycetota bacterium]